MLLTIPPTIGAAIRRITSEPVPLPHMMGSSPPMIAATVIMIGRTRMSAPWITDSCRSSVVTFSFAASRFAAAERKAWSM